MKMQWMSGLRTVFLEAVEAVHPRLLLSDVNNYNLRPQLKGNQLNITVKGQVVDIRNRQCHVVGFGKGVLGMAVQLEQALGDVLTSGILSIPKGSLQRFKDRNEYQLKCNSVVKVYEAAENNQPDELAMQAAIEIKKLATSMTANDVLFVLITGGGSALLPLPKSPLTLKEKMLLIKQLSHQGATIEEMNCVRIALSAIKGGRLSSAASKAYAIISFVISDIVNNPLDLIASGPTWMDPSTTINSLSIKAQEILKKYQLWTQLPQNIKELISKGGEEIHTKLTNNTICLIGHNGIATTAAANTALTFNYVPFVLSKSIEGNICSLVDLYIKFLNSIYAFHEGRLTENAFKDQFPFEVELYSKFLEALDSSKQAKKPLLLIMAGEPTVQVNGSGLGGRNQELALRLAIEFHKHSDLQNVWFLSGGTDGIDGPTDAAGAFANSCIIQEFYQSHHSKDELQIYLKENNSYNFYKNLAGGKYHLITGHTGTNVMDLHLFLLLL